MCGRYAYFSAHEATVRLFGLTGAAAIDARYNIAPTQFVPVVRVDHEGLRRLAMLYWGLVPSWAKDRSIGARMINARAETLAEKPAFRVAYRKRRCLLLASGYYEWQAVPGGKQPYFIRAVNGEPFGMAGLWESWVEKSGEPPLESCTIVTTNAAPPLAAIHDRMPVIVAPEDYALWLDPKVADAARLDPLLKSYPARLLSAVAVDKRVNNARNEGPELIAPLTEPLR